MQRTVKLRIKKKIKSKKKQLQQIPSFKIKMSFKNTFKRTYGAPSVTRRDFGTISSGQARGELAHHRY